MMQADMGMDAPDWVNEDQCMRQTEGWERTREHLMGILAEEGPFDGIMGFSQVHCLCSWSLKSPPGGGGGGGSTHADFVTYLLITEIIFIEKYRFIQPPVQAIMRRHAPMR